jgi:hypothetical protein
MGGGGGEPWTWKDRVMLTVILGGAVLVAVLAVVGLVTVVGWLL